MLTSEEMFETEWEGMDNGDKRIERVALYLHPSPRGIIINGKTLQSVMVDKFEGKEIKDHLLISSLAQKNIKEMTLYGCNTAHQDYAEENVSYYFITSQQKLSRVIGWDGSMRWHRLTGKPILAKNQEYFESWRDEAKKKDKRKPKGRIIYEKGKKSPETGKYDISIVPYK